MTSTPTIPPLTGTITVDAPIDRVFRTFTDGFGSWWPAEYHIGQADMATAILEPREGGRWYEQGTDGPTSTLPGAPARPPWSSANATAGSSAPDATEVGPLLWTRRPQLSRLRPLPMQGAADH